MPVDTDDDVPESAISRVRRRWQGVCGAIQKRRGVAPTLDIEGDFETKDVRTIDEKDPEVSWFWFICENDTNAMAGCISRTTARRSPCIVQPLRAYGVWRPIDTPTYIRAHLTRAYHSRRDHQYNVPTPPYT